MVKIINGIFNFFLDTIEVVLLAFGLYLILNAFVFQLHKVDGDSMLPFLHNGEYVITDKLANQTGYKRGDIVIFEYPKMPTKEFVKRLIGLPGEKLELRDSNIYIYNTEHPQGFRLEEPYLFDDTPTEPKAFLKENEIIQIPEDSYFVMGDNRTVSSDSRQWGLVPKKYMVGRALIRIWPISVIGILKEPSY